MTAKRRPGLLACAHEAGHVVATWLAGAQVVIACVRADQSGMAAPDWKFGPRSKPRWPERDRWERVRVMTAGQAAFLMHCGDMSEVLAGMGEAIAAHDRQEFEYHHDDWDVAVAESVEDLTPHRAAIDAVTGALYEHQTLDLEALEKLRVEVGL